jgi:gliding motility-associated-like protein
MNIILPLRNLTSFLLVLICLSASAQAPSFTSSPVTQAVEEQAYTYGILAEDRCNDNLTFAATTLPSWLTFSADGQNSAIKFGSTVPGPVGVAGDAEGNVYVAAQTGTAIYKITPDGTTTHWADRRGNGTSYGLYAHGDYLYIGYYQNTAGSIGRVALSNPGAGETQIYSSNGETNDLRGAVLSMVERNGYLYVALYYPNKVIKIDLSDPNFGVTSVINSGLNGPFGLGFAANGDLYVANWTGQRLHRWNGTTLTEILAPVDVGNSFISDVKVDKNGNVYISVYGSGIRKYKPDFSSFEVVKAGTSTWGMALTPTQALIFGNNDNSMYKVQTGATIFGTPRHADVGVHPVVLTVSDGENTVQQSFQITVTDPNKPVVTTFLPANNASSIDPNANLSLTFNERIKKGTGTISIRNASKDELVEEIDLSSNRVTFDGSTLTIDPVGTLPGMTNLYVNIPATAILDASDNAYLGITTNSGWKFQTKKAPSVITFASSSTTLQYGDADVSPGATSTNSAASITYTSSDPAIASIVDGKIQIQKPGSVVITASQAEDASFELAESKTMSLTINPKPLTLSLAHTPSISKTYDATTAATLAAANYVLDGVKAGDDVSFSGTVSFDNKNVGSAKTVNLSHIVLSGAHKDNYSISQSALSTTGAIVAKPISVTLNASPIISKPYDGNTTANLQSAHYALDGVISGDQLSATGTASYDTKNAGTGKVVTASQISLQGADAGNYNLTNTSAQASGNIQTLLLTLTARDASRFQGTSNPGLSWTYQGFLQGEDETVLSAKPQVSTTADISSPVGTYPITLSGASANNYHFNYVAGTLTVSPAAPANINLTAVQLFENQASGTAAGTLHSVSADPNATFTYSLVSGSGDTDNARFQLAGNELRTASPLNYEQKALYQIRVRSTTQHGFYLDKEFTVQIEDVNEAPTLAAIANQAICFNIQEQRIPLTGISAGPESNQTVTLALSTDKPELFQRIEIVNNTILYVIQNGQQGTATVSLTLTDNGGTANGGVNTFARSFDIQVNPLPNAMIYAPKTELSKGETLVLTAEGGSQYSWDFADGIIGTRNAAELTIRPERTSTYRVTVTTAEGCVSEKEITITVNEDYVMLDRVNLLSPNGDGINDNFVIENIDMYPNNEVKIYDRSGRLLYSKSNYTDEWTGTFQGSPLAQGTYYYVVDFGAGKPKLKGFISIVRD